MNITEIITAFGAYYLSHGQNKKDLHRKLTYGFQTKGIFTHVTTENTVYRAAEGSHTEVIQAFQNTWTPKGESAFTPVEIPLYKVKVDREVYPDDLEESWLGFLASNDVKRENWPFIRYMLDVMVVERIQEDLETKAIGFGQRLTPVAGTAGAAKNAINGIWTVIDKHILAGDTAPIVMGGLPTDPKLLVEYMEDYHKQLPKLYRHVGMTINVPQDVLLDYKHGYREKYGNHNDFTEGPDGTVHLKYSKLSIAGLPSMDLDYDGNPNGRIFATPKANLKLITKRFNNADGIFNVQAEDRKVKAFTDFFLGVGVDIPSIVFPTDGAAVTPPEEDPEP